MFVCCKIRSLDLLQDGWLGGKWNEWLWMAKQNPINMPNALETWICNIFATRARFCNFEEGWMLIENIPRILICIAQREKCHFSKGFMNSLVQTACSGKKNNESSVTILFNLVWSVFCLAYLKQYLFEDWCRFIADWICFLETINVIEKMWP